MIQPKAINSEKFIEFLERIADHFKGEKIAVFLDNLSVHKTVRSREAFKRLNLVPIFNVPYSPQFNGIESYFSLLKSEYKKLILQRVIKGIPVDAFALIKEALKRVEDEKTMRCVRNGSEAILK